MVEMVTGDVGFDEVVELFDVSRESSKKLELYVDLLTKWQKKINLVGPKELPKIWSRHIADALQLGEKVPTGVKNVVDLGSGGGIPGIVLAIMLGAKGIRFHLVESTAKKAAFLREVARSLNLDVKVHCERIESLHDQNWVREVDLVTARALAPLPLLMELSYPFVENSGQMLFLKGLDVDKELTETTKCWNIGYKKYPSRIDTGGYILSIKEFERVQSTKREGE